MYPRNLPVLFFAVLLFDTASAQITGTSTAGVLTAPSSGNRQTNVLRTARPIILTGNVRTASGEAPIEPVAIKRVCGVDSFIEAYTGQKGQFSFDVGGNARFAVMDATTDGASAGATPNNASIFGNQPNRSGSGVDLSHCRLIAEAPGYRSSHIRLTRRSSFDRPGVGTLILTPLGGSQAALVSATTLAAPKGAKDAFSKATKELSKGRSAKLPKAVALLEKALSQYPAYAAAWTVLGETKQRIGDAEGAAEAFASAIGADPGYLRPYEPLARIRVQQQDWQRAVELTRKALNLDPSNVVLHWLHAVSQFESGNDAQALGSLDRVESDKAGAAQFPQTHHIRGLIYSERGDFTEAAEELRLFLKAAPATPEAKAVEQRLYEWQQLGVV